ncbi:hypothetical protein [Streptomyces sp. NPDC086787]|uniref:hypothetical protein n=1 Tax=Streptomyces sp. NPDC086787 TaxID=3365759 RepID=UPI0037F57613
MDIGDWVVGVVAAVTGASVITSHVLSQIPPLAKKAQRALRAIRELRGEIRKGREQSQSEE